MINNKTSQRDAFWDKVYDLAKDDKDIMIVSADMGAPSLDKFRKDFPSQFVNVGIAEQNAILVASGLAMEGKKAYAYAIAPFITLRCLEQIRVENSMMKLPITIVGVGAGLSYEDSGPTHHLLEDIAVMRSLPNISIHNMTDSVMAEAFAGICADGRQSRYIRLDRHVQPVIYKTDSDFSKGLSMVKRSGDVLIISTGNMVHVASEVSAAIEKSNIGTCVMDIYSFPVNTAAFLHEIEGIKKIITLEEHFLSGGLGSAVLEVMADNGIMLPVKRIGIDPSAGFIYEYGGRENIREKYGISRAIIEKKITDYLKR